MNSTLVLNPTNGLRVSLDYAKTQLAYHERSAERPTRSTSRKRHAALAATWSRNILHAELVSLRSSN
jgi:hypothetical protein